MKHVHISETEFPGVVEIVASGWDGRILKMTRDAYFKLRQRTEGLMTKTAGTYILYSSGFDRSDEESRKLYIGKTKNAKQRGDSHEREKEFWTDVLVFTSYGSWMNSAHAGALEQQFIAWARKANRYTVTNGTDGGVEPLGPCDEAILGLFKRDVRSVAQMAGIDVFEPDPLGLFFFEQSSMRPRGQALKAKGRLDRDGLLVLAGSTLPVPFVGETGYEFLDTLEKEGHVTRHDDVVTVVEDVHIPFVGTSRRILGSYPIKWLTASRRKLTSVLREEPSDHVPEPDPNGDVATT